MRKASINRPCFLMLLVLCLGCDSDSARQVDYIPPANKAQETVDSVFLVIDYDADCADTLAMVLVSADTLTVLDLLENITTRNRIVLQTREYQFGTLVEQIGDRKNGDGGYWLYTVNSEPIPLAASAYQTKPGDTVRFFFE